MYCENCKTDCEVNIKEEQETYRILNKEDITINAKVTYCSICKNQIFNIDVDNENIKNAYEKYKEKKGLLSSQEIGNIISQYKDLSIGDFANILGIEPRLLISYISGAIQPEIHNNLLLLMKNSENMKILKNIKRGTGNCRCLSLLHLS